VERASAQDARVRSRSAIRSRAMVSNCRGFIVVASLLVPPVGRLGRDEHRS
jgi:hypothetical protein